MDEPSGNEQFFNAHNFVPQNVCRMSENQNFCLRRRFSTSSLKIITGIDVHTSGTKKIQFFFPGMEILDYFQFPLDLQANLNVFFHTRKKNKFVLCQMCAHQYQ